MQGLMGDPLDGFFFRVHRDHILLCVLRRRLGDAQTRLELALQALSIWEKKQILRGMGAILGNDGIGGARSIFPSRLEFTFYEMALPAAQYRDSHIQSLGGGWYCYCELPWLFTYRTVEWTEQEVKAHRARIHKLLW